MFAGSNRLSLGEDVMRPITRTTICALAAAAVAAPALAAVNAYLEVGPIKGESSAKARGGHKDWIEVESWSWGATQAGSWNGTIKGAASTEKFGTVSGSHRDDSVAGDGRADVTSPRDAASGMPTEKRQHGWVTFAKPLDRGSVRVKVKFPWDRCAVGAAFPDAVLQNDAGRYELKDIQVTGCAADGVSLNYAKVTVRGWDPKAKQQ